MENLIKKWKEVQKELKLDGIHLEIHVHPNQEEGHISLSFRKSVCSLSDPGFQIVGGMALTTFSVSLSEIESPLYRFLKLYGAGILSQDSKMSPISAGTIVLPTKESEPEPIQSESEESEGLLSCSNCRLIFPSDASTCPHCYWSRLGENY